jgi:hypothetical protein
MNAMRLVTMATLTLASVGCVSFSVLTPAPNATVPSPTAVDLYWNGDLQPGTLKVVDNATDVTAQFSLTGTNANSHATANLALGQGPHTITVSGNLFSSGSYSPYSATQSFTVSNSGHAVTYTQTVLNYTPGWPAGSLGSFTFGGTSANPNVNLIFTFEGNTADIVPYHVHTTKHAVNDGDGMEIIAGTATITIQDASTRQTLAQATFLPAARVFVSVDNGNGGIGFGALGALPTDPTFPSKGVEVAYPYALLGVPRTDLASNYRASSQWALSCVGFNGSPGQPGPAGSCNVPILLATTGGALSITSNNQQDTSPPGSFAGTFTTVVH